MAPTWVRSLSHKLRETGLVNNIQIWPAKLSVRYNTGVIERYWFISDKPPRKHIHITRASGKITTEIPIVKLVESDLLQPDRTEFQYVAIGKRAWAAGTTIDRALALQRFTAMACEIGYQGRVPHASLIDDLNNLRAYDQAACQLKTPNGVLIDFYPRHNHRPGDHILGHFFDYERAPRPPTRQCLITAASRPRLVHRLARRLEYAHKRISSHNIMKTIRKFAGPRLMFCRAYAALLERLGARSVYDPDPETGAKALACALLHIPYYTDRVPLFDEALQRGFAGFIDLDHRYTDEASEIPHYALVDRNFASYDYDAALDLAARAQRLAIYVPAASKGEAVEECAPESIVDCHMYRNRVGHYFIW